jgi:hypothetical protein
MVASSSAATWLKAEICAILLKEKKNLTSGGIMRKRKQWKVHRCTTQREDGQRRWDEAYQFLLQCMMENREKALDERTRKEEQEE